MRRYGLPEGIWLSFYSKRFYQVVAATWRGRALAYLLLVTGLTTLPSYIRMHRALTQAFAQIRADMVNKVPEISIIKGEVHTPEAKPYDIRFGKGPSDWILVDPTGQTTSLSQTSAAVLMTRNQVLFRKSPVETRIYSLAGVDRLVINEERISHWLDIFRRWFPILFYPFLFLLQTFFRWMEALVLALAGLLLVQWLEARLDFVPLMSLAVASLTPAFLVSGFFSATRGHVHHQGVVIFSLVLGYYLYAVNAATDTPLDEPIE